MNINLPLTDAEVNDLILDRTKDKLAQTFDLREKSRDIKSQFRQKFLEQLEQKIGRKYRKRFEEIAGHLDQNGAIVFGALLSDFSSFLGANPNLANSRWWGDNVIGDISEGTTPLWIAAEKTTNLELVKMLRKYGAVVYLELSEKGKAMIDQADRENCNEQFNQNKYLFQAMLYQQGLFAMLPTDVIKLIIHGKLKVDALSLFDHKPKL